ncbi:hypothetical protein [Streptomyces sp. NPDC058305]|uniref:hypothetical protein n=1 Tax=Streptomyces sp. NPDC058305 TaxID=3346438 RepID=UPI0036E7981E
MGRAPWRGADVAEARRSSDGGVAHGENAAAEVRSAAGNAVPAGVRDSPRGVAAYARPGGRGLVADRDERDAGPYGLGGERRDRGHPEPGGDVPLPGGPLGDDVRDAWPEPVPQRRVEECPLGPAAPGHQSSSASRGSRTRLFRPDAPAEVEVVAAVGAPVTG